MYVKLKTPLIAYFLLISFVACKEKQKLTENSTVDNRPNIILVITDDLGYSDVGFNGAKDISTPNLDELARNGTIFSSAYVAHPFCGPSRAALMTGRYPHTIGSQFNLPANSEVHVGKGITLEETFMSKMLQDAGYYTSAVGKWHLGAVPKYHPNDRGFNDFYGFLGGGHKYFPEEYTAKYTKQKAAGREVIFDYLKPLEHNGKIIENPTEYLTDELSRKAIDFVNVASKKDSPFFMYLAYNAPHVPLEAKEEDLKIFEHIEDTDRRTYAAMVYAVDRGIGDLARALKLNGEYDNTLVVFLSDNGGHTGKGATNNPLTGRKGDTWEGGYRVPMLFHWPKKVAQGKIFSYPVSALDFYPTFAHLAKAEIPSSKILDGRNVWEAIGNDQNFRKDEMVFVLRHREGYSDVGVRQNQFKALKTNQNKWQLFDIGVDIGETNDISEQHPEQLKKMVAAVEKWSKSHTKPQWFDPEELSIDWKEKQMGEFGSTFKLEMK
ncbi:sulfatase [Maribacter algarum]|uniref:Sulfatase n=1 Tax=Maribacter algarum (ex Zhang et al. 2020) TaxID=2578118 RepID=A0A5S3QET3_9FLAO|nr:sulfatase-like hydrolase/transferase [Maribacter algarum]TMM55767.1 sulfatase [Maribacter algarum]